MSRHQEAISNICDGPLNETSLYRFRKQRGVNLGSWFVLERWITDKPFRQARAPAQSDLDVALGSHAKEILESHWDSWIAESDWEWMSNMGINSVRLPIGYYHLCGADRSVLHGTDFKNLYSVFQGAWGRILNAIATANCHGIGVLLDLHAAPGKQNRDSHSGTSNDPTFFNDHRNKIHTTEILRVLIQNLAKLKERHIFNVLGIELLNEPQPPSDQVLKEWYSITINELRNIVPDIPIILSDTWKTERYTDYISSHPSPRSLILDHHLYRCFTSTDISTPAAQHAHSLTDPNAHTPCLFTQTSEKLTSAGGALIVGEWSGALNPGSLHGVDENRARADFISAQLDLYERCCAGWFFWTLKKENPGDKGWSLRDAVEAGVFPRTIGLRRKSGSMDDGVARSQRRDQYASKALNEHTSYWSQYPGYYEHWRFSDGFYAGWEDSYLFSNSQLHNPNHPVSELGFQGAWLKYRIEGHISQKGGDQFLWEFEHGFNQGVGAAQRDFKEKYS